MIEVAVMGALGRMGREVCGAVLRDPELALTGAVDPGPGGEVTEPLVEGTDLRVVQDRSELDRERTDVIVDFTHADAALSNVKWALSEGVHCVVGTTGIPEIEIRRIGELSAEVGANVIIASNFAPGAVLMMRFAEMAAGVFDQCEIIELHHRGKRDAPSGTAIATARSVDSAMRASRVPPPRVDGEVPGARGGNLGPVHIHSVRLDGLVAHQEVIFGSTGETLTIRHDTTDRSSFMRGVVLAIKYVGDIPGLTVGIESLLQPH